jgi:hypothetical protein
VCGAFGTFAHQAYTACLRGQLSSNVRRHTRHTSDHFLPMNTKHGRRSASCLVLLGLAALVAPPSWAGRSELPEGRWTGTVMNRGFPEKDKPDTVSFEVALVHCGKSARLHFKNDDGTFDEGVALQLFPYRKTFLLIYAAVEREDWGGWVETQVWTLVDARPSGWTITRSRSVLNQDLPADDALFTFRSFTWGTLEYDSSWCQKRREQAPSMTPNPSFKPTRSGRQRKPGVRHLRHLRTPGLRCLPPRAA